MIADLGAVTIERDVQAHDQAVALISHTPQVVASVLAGLLVDAKSDQVALAGQGLRDTIRIASSDAKLWTEILSGNAKNVSKQISDVSDQLANFAKALEAGDTDQVSTVLARGVTGRDRLPGKHGSAQKADGQVIVRLEDKPGELARLFTVAANAEVNLEDVRIDHSLGRMTGLVELTVAQEKRDVLITALTSADFVVVN
jgi:prephenate dehydrogenase